LDAVRSHHALHLALFDPVFFGPLFAGEVHPLDVHVDLHHFQTRHRLNRPLDVFLDVVSDLGDADTVLDHDEEVDGGLLFTHFDLDALGEVFPSQELSDAAGDAAAHPCHSLDVRCGKAGDDAHHFVGDPNVAQLSPLFLFRHWDLPPM